MARYLSMRARPPDAGNRLSLCLIQDEATVTEIAATDTSLDEKGVLQWVHGHCFGLGIVATVTSNQALMQGQAS